MLLLRWFINALTLVLVSELVPGFQVDSLYTALVAALILGLLNALVRPILFLFTLPITVLTLGLFTFIINASMLWLTASIVKGFTISNFGSAIVGALIIWLISWVTNWFLNNADSKKAQA